jgi:hypothetical protein
MLLHICYHINYNEQYDKLDLRVTVHHHCRESNTEHQLDATITALLISKYSSTCFGQIFAHLQERKTEIFTAYDIMSC